MLRYYHICRLVERDRAVAVEIPCDEFVRVHDIVWLEKMILCEASLSMEDVIARFRGEVREELREKSQCM